MSKEINSFTPQLDDWVVKSAEEASEIAKVSKDFKRVKANVHSTEGEEIMYGWYADLGSGDYIFIPYDKQNALDTNRFWVENPQDL